MLTPIYLMLVELVLLALIIFVIGPTIFVGFVDLCLFFCSFTIFTAFLEAGLDIPLDMSPPTCITKPRRH